MTIAGRRSGGLIGNFFGRSEGAMQRRPLRVGGDPSGTNVGVSTDVPRSAAAPMPPASAPGGARTAVPPRMPGSPAGVGGRVPHSSLRKVLRQVDLPLYTQVLSGAGAPVDVGPADRSKVAILLVEDNGVVIIWTNEASALTALKFARDRATRAGFKIIEEVEAPAPLIAMVHDAPPPQRGTVAGVEIEKDQVDSALEAMVSKAVELRASDIHLEVGPSGATIRFRINGDLVTQGTMAKREAEELSRGIYLRSEVSTKATQFDPKLCQDTAIALSGLKVVGRDKPVNVKLRFASMPAYPEGWDITLRVLASQEGDVIPLSALGYDSGQVTAFEYAASQPVGMVCLAGSTGSGKSTTLSTLCHIINDQTGGRKKIRSIEDPPEYILPGRQHPVLRTPADEEAGINPFNRYLKAAMRGDPDVLYIGEVRDADTAALLQQAVMSGHKVLTTIHASSPFLAVARLLDLGVDRGVMTSGKFVSGIIYQRLVAVLCPHCKRPIGEMTGKVDPALMARIMRVRGGDASDVFFRGPGCDKCRDGVKGRTVVAEILVPDNTILDFMSRGDLHGAARYWRAAADRGANIDVRGVSMGQTALDQAIRKMLAGEVDPEEVEREVGRLDDQEPASDALTWWKRYQSMKGG